MIDGTRPSARTKTAVVGLLIVTATIGCRESFLGFPYPRVAELATEQQGLEGPSFVVPDTAYAWVPFEVEVATYQNAYCEASAGAEVERNGMRAIVTPLVRTVGGPSCPDAAALRPIRATVMFPRPGPASVTFDVRQDPRVSPLDVEYAVEVVDR